MTGRAVIREGSCPSVQKREGRCPGGQVSGRASVRLPLFIIEINFIYHTLTYQRANVTVSKCTYRQNENKVSKIFVQEPTRLDKTLYLFLTNRPTIIKRCSVIPGLGITKQYALTP